MQGVKGSRRMVGSLKRIEGELMGGRRRCVGGLVELGGRGRGLLLEGFVGGGGVILGGISIGEMSVSRKGGTYGRPLWCAVFDVVGVV